MSPSARVEADVPKKPPPTIEWQVRHSPMIAICEVERIGFVYDEVKGGPATFSEIRPGRWAELQTVMEVRVVEWLRPPRRHSARPLRVLQFSSYEIAEYREKYLGRRFLFFLSGAYWEDRRNDDPDDYFTEILSTVMHGGSRPESLAHEAEVRRLLMITPDARPYGQ